ncbi:MAG TPA: HAMP domain-containing sensor histidine kinase [Thermoanaerobaculia bacterium]|nr:HAMP domain-containing sensor histidine kinase [Thermoanaerobaculia bacterium]
MKLGTRITLALLGIVALLVIPSVYGLSNLWELQEIAETLESRNAAAAVALGNLQTAVGEFLAQQRIYLALAGPEARDDRGAVADRLAEEAGKARAALDELEAAGFGEEGTEIERLWGELRMLADEQQRLVEAERIDAADALHDERVQPLAAEIEPVLARLAGAIDRRGEEAVGRAEAIAADAANRALMALAAALLAVLVLSVLFTRMLVGPIQDLVKATRVVGRGEFDAALVTAQRRSDELGELSRAFQSMTRDLAELDRLKAEFVSIASHELKTPLSVITGYVGLMRQGMYGPLTEKGERVLDTLDRQARQLERLIRQLLEISRFEAGGGRLDLQTIELPVFLGHFADSFEPLATQHRVDFQVATGSDLPPSVVGDRDRLEEVVGNLLSNAFKFTPEGGRIRLAAGSARLDGGSPAVAIEVVDTGPGIPADMLPRIFEKFFQLDGEKRAVGSGLGLAIAREIVEAHGGTISAESVEGQGATFRVRLPLEPPAVRST